MSNATATGGIRPSQKTTGIPVASMTPPPQGGGNPTVATPSPPSTATVQAPTQTVVAPVTSPHAQQGGGSPPPTSTSTSSGNSGGGNAGVKKIPVFEIIIMVVIALVLAMVGIWAYKTFVVDDNVDSTSAPVAELESTTPTMTPDIQAMIAEGVAKALAEVRESDLAEAQRLEAATPLVEEPEPEEELVAYEPEPGQATIPIVPSAPPAPRNSPPEIVGQKPIQGEDGRMYSAALVVPPGMRDKYEAGTLNPFFCTEYFDADGRPTGSCPFADPSDGRIWMLVKPTNSHFEKKTRDGKYLPGSRANKGVWALSPPPAAQAS